MMDLSLMGSQINLATRTGSTVSGNKHTSNHTRNYIRPHSAFASTGRNKILQRSQNHNKRPLSAENIFNDSINELHDKKSKQSKNNIDSKKKNASSSNLMNLLLSERKQSSSWTPIESDIQSERSSVVTGDNFFNIRKKYGETNLKVRNERGNMDSDNVSKNDHKNDEGLTESSNSTPSPLQNVSSTKKTLKISNINRSKGILKQDLHNETHHRSLDLDKSYQKWVAENIKNKNIDLPGRVSFSTDDVCEFENSDETDNSLCSSPNLNLPKPISNKYNNLYTFASDYLNNTDDEPHILTDGTAEIYSDADSNSIKLRYNILHDKNVAEMHMESKAKEEANKIVEEYKKEINELKKVQAQNPYTSATVGSPKKTKDYPFSFPIDTENMNSTVRCSDAFSTTSNTEEPFTTSKNLFSRTNCNMENRENFNDKPRSATKTEINSSTNSLTELPDSEPFSAKLNNFWENNNDASGLPITNFSSSNTNIPNGISIRNHLKNKNNFETTNVRSANDSKNSNELHTGYNKKRSKEDKKKTITARARSAPLNMSMKIKKSKSVPLLKDDHKIDEFQLDKVESWMSIHESDNYSDTTSMVDDTKRNNDLLSFNWKSKLTVSSIEDEGTFSTEDALDVDSPYEEIVSVIKEIDEDKLNKGAAQSLKTDVNFKLNTILSTIETPDSAISDDEKMTSSSKAESSKISEIMNYLDESDNRCERTLQNIKQTQLENSNGNKDDQLFVYEPDFTDEIPKVSELLMLTNHQLCRKIVSLSLRATELNNAIQLSKEHVSNVRAEKMKTVRLEKQNTQKRLNEQKRHFEDIIQRHQTFIEQLLKDKTNLCEKVSHLSRRLESQNQAWEHKLKTEVERAKETVLAGEKLKKEKWIRDNTKKIKEFTVKGLEAEINRMQSQHQEELNELKKSHQKELMQTVDDLNKKFEEKERELRDSYSKDKENVIDRERSAIVQRFEKQIEEERKIFEQQKQHLINEFEADKERISKDVQMQKSNYDKNREKLKMESMDLLNQAKAEFKEKIKQREMKYQKDMKKLEEQFETDFAVWKREHEAKMKLRECERENYIRQQNRIERDRQIDSIVAKVDAEALKNQQEFEMKISRLKEKYEREIKELEKMETETRGKYIEQKTKLAESETNTTNLEASLKQIETQLNHFKKMCDELIKERETVKVEVKRELQIEMKTVQQDCDAEIQRIYTRVQKAIEKKDTTIEMLQKDNTKLKERCMKLDALVKQQRKDYIKK